jgi:ABC-type sulfate/molybdate transport systems ATPase subunit
MEEKESEGIALEAAGVDVLSAYNHRVQIAGVDWSVRLGEYWVVGGRHGSGKTDLLMTMAGLRHPGGGTVRIFGREIAQMSEGELLKRRARIGFVFKGGGRMFGNLTVAENVALPLCYHRNWSLEEAREDVGAVLAATELTSLAGEAAQTLGTEWQQRIGLARALVLKPEVLLLDEPAGGLEVRHRQWWRDYLAQLSAGRNGRKVTVIAATNDFAVWRGENHRVGLIKDQRWQVVDHPSEHLEIE